MRVFADITLKNFPVITDIFDGVVSPFYLSLSFSPALPEVASKHFILGFLDLSILSIFVEVVPNSSASKDANNVQRTTLNQLSSPEAQQDIEALRRLFQIKQ